MIAWKKIIPILFTLLVSSAVLLHAQNCSNEFSSLVYKGITFDSFTKVMNVNSEMIAAGSLYNDKAATGVYVYELRMEGLSGNKTTQHGTFLLIR